MPPALSAPEAGAPLTLGEATRRAAEHLSSRGIATARLDAELLMAHALGITRLQLHLDFDRPLTEGERARARALIVRRARREPVAHITGEREFFSLAFEVTPDVLVPRPETELLVETVLELESQGRLPSGPLLDIGTGSGCLAVALAHGLPSRQVVGTDISRAALAVARRNAARHGVEGRVEFIEGDLAAESAGPFAAIVSNPPYIAEAERSSLAPEVLREPGVALFGGADGLDVIRRLVAAAAPLLVPLGWLVIEAGHGQAAAVAALVRNTHTCEEVRTLRDLAGIQRAIVARRDGLAASEKVTP